MTDEKCKELLKRYSNPDGIGFPDVKEACKYAVDNFVPVSVIEDIKSEIQALPKIYPFVNHIDTYVKDADVIKIIERHCGGDNE